MNPAPPHDVADDIWIEIFKCCVAVESGTRPFHIDKAGKEARYTTVSRSYPLDQVWHAPWSLLWVCRKWRHMALTHPELWTSVHIPVASEASTLPLQVQHVNELLERSRSWPLSIRFVSLVRQPCLNTLNSILRHHARCQSLSLTSRPSVVLFDLLRACPWPSLSTLRIGLLFTPHVDVPEELDLSFLPALRHFVEEGSRGQSINIKVPLHMLESLEFHLPSPHIAFHFGLMPRLASLRILVPDSMAFDHVTLLGLPGGITDLKCPNLQHLHLKNCLGLSPLFHDIALQSLSIGTVFTSRGSKLICQLLRASETSLREVELNIPFMLMDDLLIQALLDMEKVAIFKINIQLAFDLAWQSFDWDSRQAKGICELLRQCRVTASSHPLPLLAKLEVGIDVEGGDDDPLFCQSVTHACSQLVRDIVEPLGNAWESRALYTTAKPADRLVAQFTFKAGRETPVCLEDERLLELFADKEDNTLL